MKTEDALYFLQAAQTLARYHQTLGIDHYPATAKLSALTQEPRPNKSPISPKTPGREQAALPASRQTTAMASVVDMVSLENCRLCPTSDIQPQTARAGRLSQTPKLFVVGDYRHGENPDGECIFGKEEDELLAKMLAAIALRDDDVSITNLVKCHPATNDATSHEPGDAMAGHCLAHLRSQLLVARPRLILAMGDLPARVLTEEKSSLSALRGRLHNFFPLENQPVPVLVSYHPTFLIAQSEMKKAAWEDLKMARRFLASLPLTVRTAKR